MITNAEFAQRARTLGLQQSHVFHDYVLNHVLASIAFELPELVFRGGTALARVYWPDFRLSEDLDFVSQRRLPSLKDGISSVAKRASAGMRLPIDLEEVHDQGGWRRWLVRCNEAAIQIDVNEGERAYLGVERRPLVLPYSDLSNGHVTVMHLAEILANKIFMLIDRDEPRDLYDLWWGLERADVAFEEIARAHKQKYGHGPVPQAIISAERLRALWSVRLAHQIDDLPTFDSVMRDVLARLRPAEEM